jgi:hypothetical protein
LGHSTAHGLPAAHELLREEIERLANPVVDNVLDLPTQQSLLVLLQVRFLKANRQNVNECATQSQGACASCTVVRWLLRGTGVAGATGNNADPVIRCGSEAAMDTLHPCNSSRPMLQVGG